MRVKLGDVAVESRETYKGSQSGIPIVGLEHLAPQEVSLAEWTVDTENTFSKMFRKGQVLFGRRRAYLKKAAVAPCDGICSGDITVIAAKADALAPGLLPFIIQNDRFFDFSVEKSAGSLSPRVKWEHLRDFEFDLPPMGEQLRLAEVLWAFDETRQAYKKLLKLTDELVKSQFVEMFGDGINDSKWNRVPLTKACKSSDDIKCGPFGTQLRNADYQREGVPVYAIPQVNSAFQKEPTDYLAEEKAEQLRTYSLIPDDIAMSRKGNVGTCALFPQSLTEGIIHSDVLRIRVNSEKVNPVFLIAQLHYSPAVTRQIELVSQGAIMAGTNVTKLKGIKIELPPLSLQNRFADFVRQADKSKFELNRTLEELEAAYKALVRERLG
ncbi:Restriction endonuclease S subunits [uncultured Eubacteriales bacterium]|uniref:Restriction endonuclease S subunits n=1 Tax=uncultured Eubacteriales bacterium TaxID=172733 RepID=A0A212K2V9_9FIRM|nr:Restriction endonuclease S subunits [uncultured Eubacteriales bacterium]